MEGRASAKPYFPISYPPEKNLRHLYRRSRPFWPESSSQQPQIPFYPSSSTQDLTVSISHLNLNTSSYQPPQIRRPAAATSYTASTEECTVIERYFNSIASSQQEHISDVIQTTIHKGVFPVDGSRAGCSSGAQMVQESDQWRVSSEDHGLSMQCTEQKPIDDFRGQIFSFVQDQTGSLILQRKIVESNQDQIEWVLNEVIDFIEDLLKHRFSTQFIQRLFQKCSEQQMTMIIAALTKSNNAFASLCCHPVGTKAIVKLLENVSTPEQLSLIISNLTTDISEMVTYKFCQQVLLYIIANFLDEYITPLVEIIEMDCYKFATNKNGYRVIQSIIEYCEGPAKADIVTKMIESVYFLSEDPYGHFVVLHLLEMNIPEVTAGMLRYLHEWFTELSCNKYGSKVVKGFLVESGEENAQWIVMKLLNTPDNAFSVMIHPFGHFVIQTALSVSKGNVHKFLVDMIEANAQMLEDNVYGRNVLASV